MTAPPVVDGPPPLPSVVAVGLFIGGILSLAFKACRHSRRNGSKVVAWAWSTNEKESSDE